VQARPEGLATFILEGVINMKRLCIMLLLFNLLFSISIPAYALEVSDGKGVQMSIIEGGNVIATEGRVEQKVYEPLNIRLWIPDPFLDETQLDFYPAMRLHIPEVVFTENLKVIKRYLEDGYNPFADLENKDTAKYAVFNAGYPMMPFIAKKYFLTAYHTGVPIDLFYKPLNKKLQGENLPATHNYDLMLEDMLELYLTLGYRN